MVYSVPCPVENDVKTIKNSDSFVFTDDLIDFLTTLCQIHFELVFPIYVRENVLFIESWKHLFKDFDQIIIGRPFVDALSQL